MTSKDLSTLCRRFTHVRLPSTHLTGLRPPFPRTLTTPAVVPEQLPVVWTLTLPSGPEGPTLISHAAGTSVQSPTSVQSATSLSRRRGAQQSVLALLPAALLAGAQIA
jgi:hypothetical protein